MKEVQWTETARRTLEETTNFILELWSTDVNKSGEGTELLADIFFQTIQIVNIPFIGEQGTEDFVLVDAGMPITIRRLSGEEINYPNATKT